MFMKIQATSDSKAISPNGTTLPVAANATDVETELDMSISEKEADLDLKNSKGVELLEAGLLKGLVNPTEQNFESHILQTRECLK